MKRLLFTGLHLGLLSAVLGGLLEASSLTDPLTDLELSEVLPLLQTRYPENNELRDKNLNPTALSSLLPSLGATLSPDPFKNSHNDPLKIELLPSAITYWRLSSFEAPKGTPDLSAAFATSLRGPSKGLILDLRDSQTPNDYEGAARVAANLVPIGTVLFSIQGQQTPQQVFPVTEQRLLYTKPLLVLINRDTLGAAEALAASLRRSAKAILIGRTTAGLGGLFTELKLKSGRYLRLPQAQAILPDGTKLFGQPVQPDIPIFVKDNDEHEALAQIRIGPAAAGLNSTTDRRYMSEAALVREENPEIDNALKKDKSSKGAPPMIDVALVRAVDVMMGILSVYPATPEVR
jgi:Peptidase family S41